MDGLVVGTERGKLIIYRSKVAPLKRTKKMQIEEEWLEYSYFPIFYVSSLHFNVELLL